MSPPPYVTFSSVLSWLSAVEERLHLPILSVI